MVVPRLRAVDGVSHRRHAALPARRVGQFIVVSGICASASARCFCKSVMTSGLPSEGIM